MLRKIILVILIVFCALLLVYVSESWGKASPDILSNPTITLIQEGFVPQNVTIHKGDTVTFTTTTNKPFWPASNLHPTHSVYSAFDPRAPIPPEESWSFTFDKVGKWEFHDHLAPGFTGVITVVGDNGELPQSSCEETSDEAVKQQCWEAQILATLKRKDIPEALRELAVLSRDDIFNKDCHGYAHLIGEEGYRIFGNKGGLGLTPQVSLCGYGFFHGFMETLLFTTNDITQARSFCDYVEQELSGSGSSGSTLACYHGIGHGFTDGSDPRAWGSPDKMSAPGIEMCRRVSTTALEEYVCVAGVFNSLEILSTDPQYNLTELQEHPYDFCARQPLVYQEPCYTNMLIAVLRLTKDDVGKALLYIESHITNKENPSRSGSYTTEEMVILSLMAEFMRLNIMHSDYIEKGIALCRTLSDPLNFACVEGLSFGHMKYGKPEEAKSSFLNFCSSSLLTEGERDACYRFVLKRISLWYDAKPAQEICNATPEAIARQYCKL